MSDEWIMIKKNIMFFGFIGILFSSFIIPFENASALNNMGDIAEFINDENNLGCEYITVEDSKFSPVKFSVETDSRNPTFSGVVEPITSDVKYSEETVVGDDKSLFRFNSESIGEFRIILRDDMQNRNDTLDRNFFYRWEVSDADNNANINQELGNWFSNERKFCKIIEFVTEEPFRERTEEEILEITEKDRRERDAVVDERLEEISAGLVIITVGFVIFVCYVLVTGILKQFNKKKPEAEAEKFKRLLGIEIKRFKEMTDYALLWFTQKDLELEKWKQVFVTLVYDAMHLSKTIPEGTKFELKPLVNPYLELTSKHTGLNLREFANSLMDKMKSKSKDPRAEFIEDVANADNEKLTEMYKEWQKKAVENPEDEDYYFKTNYLWTEIKKRSGN